MHILYHRSRRLLVFTAYLGGDGIHGDFMRNVVPDIIDCTGGGVAKGGTGMLGLEGLESRWTSTPRLLRLAATRTLRHKCHHHHANHIPGHIHDAIGLSYGDLYRRDHCKCHCQPSKSFADPGEPVGGFTCFVC